MKKIIQIVACPSDQNNWRTIYCLDEEGRIWKIPDDPSIHSPQWKEIKLPTKE